MRALIVWFGLCLPAAAFGSDGTVLAPAASADAPRYTVHSASIEVAPQDGGRYSMSARFAREEGAGELREGGEFVLLGRFAKRGVSCQVGDSVFEDGFEAP